MVVIAGSDVGPLGYGLMGFTWAKTPVPIEKAIPVLKAAVDHGALMWNGGEFYGPPEYNSLHLIRKYFETYPDDRSRIRFSIKGGVNRTTFKPDSSPEGIRKSIQFCKSILGDIPLDIFEPARMDPDIGVDVTLKALKEVYDEGLVRGISLSEVGPETVKKAIAILGPALYTVEVEISLFETTPLTGGLGAVCREAGIPLTAYSPLGRGFLTGRFKKFDDLPDMLKGIPRYQGENFATNMKLVDEILALASARGCTPAQLAIGWLVTQSGRNGNPEILPIPGATSESRINENFKVVRLTDAEMSTIDGLLKKLPVAGGRYADDHSKYLSV